MTFSLTNKVNVISKFLKMWYYERLPLPPSYSPPLSLLPPRSISPDRVQPLFFSPLLSLLYPASIPHSPCPVTPSLIIHPKIPQTPLIACTLSAGSNISNHLLLLSGSAYQERSISAALEPGESGGEARYSRNFGWSFRWTMLRWWFREERR